MTNSNPLLKTCQACGLQKPISAFLQLNDKNSTTYGNICANCRKSSQEKESSEEGTKKTNHHRLGHEQRTADEIDKQHQVKQAEEDYYKERETDDKKERDIRHQKEEKHTKEKEHRETFLKQAKTPLNQANNANRFQFGGVEQTEKEAQFDFNSPLTDTEVAIPKMKHQSILFKQFIDWLPKNAPIVKAVKKALKRNEKEINNSPTEFIEKKWTPTNRNK